MAKPTRIQHGGVGIYLNDKQADRVQTFGSSTALNPEELKEVGNVNIVEVIDGVPTVDITLDSNQYGSVKTTAQLANINFDYGYPQVSPSGGLSVDVGTGPYFINERKYDKAAVSTMDLTANLPATPDYWRLVCISITTAGVLHATNGAEFDPTGTFAYPTTPAGELKLAEVALKNAMTTITDDHILNMHDAVTVEIGDFEYAKVDVVSPVKEHGDNNDTTEYITRTMYIENAFCNRVDLAFNTDGLSTENFSLESDNKKWFLNSARTVVVDRLARAVDPGVYTLTQTPTQLADLNYTLKCRVFDPSDGSYEVKEEGTDYDVNPAGPTATFRAGCNPAAGTVLIFRYCANINEDESFLMLPNPKESHPDPTGGVKQGQVEIYMTDDSTDFVLRIESATITADIGREALNEIGHALPYDRPVTFPVPVTIAVNTKASDLEEFARMIGRRAEFVAGTIDEMDIDRFSKNLGFRIYIYREPDTKRDEVPFMFFRPIKTISIDNVSVTDENFEIAVDSDATQTFNLKADNLTMTAMM